MPLIPLKHFSDMALDELRRERAHWDSLIVNANGWGGAVAAAAEFRRECDTEIKLREQELERA